MIPSSWLDELLSGPLPDTVDVVVVGAGAAGCVLASRLSERPERSVLLIEAGEVVDEAASVPGDVLALLGSSAFYRDETVPQPGAAGRRVPVATGRGLGGGTAVNGMSWFQGQPADYDGWAAAGATGWAWNDVAPILRRIEHHALGPSRHHGAGGPMAVSTASTLAPIDVDFVAAGEQVGLPVSEDLNGAQRWGVGSTQSTIRDGRRHGVVEGYLRSALSRPNLTVRTGVAAERVLFDGRRAIGVACAGRTVRAGRVVLSAGSLRTPQLLMLSGVGPAEHLREHGIEVVADRVGVGENLHDHPTLQPLWPLEAPHKALAPRGHNARLAYRLLRRGPLASFSPVAAMIPLDGYDLPDVQAFLTVLDADPDRGPVPGPAVMAMVALLTPDSRGRVRLRSGSVLDGPDVDPAYLSAPDDLPRLRAGLARVSEMFDAPALRRSVGPRVIPPARVDADELDTYVRQNVATFWHAVGTARMGRDADSVVDPGLAVRGVERLHVADASVMPTITRGNTQAPTIMIAERAATLLDDG